MPHSIQRDQHDRLSSVWWGLAVAAWLFVMIVSGGTTFPSTTVTTLQVALSVIIVAIASWKLKHGFPTWLSFAGVSFLALSLGLVLLQLLPLPPEIWTQFPQRNLITETYAAAGLPLPWLPMNMQPSHGLTSALAFLPAIAGFLAAVTLRPRSAIPVVLAILLCALASVFLGLSQRFSSGSSGFYLYQPTAKGLALGTFSNRNFFGAQLFTAIPFVAALALMVTDRWHVRPWLTAIFAVVYTGVLLAGLATVGSRGGVLLAMLAVVLTFAFVFRWHRFAQSGATVIASLAALFLLSQAGMVGILRLVDRDPLQDFRSTILKVSFEATKAFFPVGSGFGSFVSAYQIFERPADIIDKYVNQAHNDWLELVLVGGLPSLVLLIVFLVLVGVAIVRLARFGLFSPMNALSRAALVCVVLLMVHAVVDFGLRTPALLTVFAVSLGFITLPGATMQSHGNRQPPTDQQPVPVPKVPPRPFVPGRFAKRSKSAAGEQS